MCECIRASCRRGGGPLQTAPGFLASPMDGRCRPAALLLRGSDRSLKLHKTGPCPTLRSLGNRRWVDSLEWAGSAEWAAATDEVWTVGGKEAGKVKTSGPLSFVSVSDAGHMVPMDRCGRCGSAGGCLWFLWLPGHGEPLWYSPHSSTALFVAGPRRPRR
jgi:hypothetical protein